jgi:hypothetical protein
MATHARTHRSQRYIRSVAGLSVAVALTLAPGMAPATAAVDDAARAANPLTIHIKAADQYVVAAVADVRARHFYRARAELAAARSHINSANAEAKALIGKPPADPESDDPPGPPAVIAATGLDSRTTVRLLPLFNGMKNSKTVPALVATVATAQVARDSVLNPVLALPGHGGDYADGLTDTLPVYKREVSSIANALATFHLSRVAVPYLKAALARAQAINAKMNKAYGGGE